jgi:hypothetical protein
MLTGNKPIYAQILVLSKIGVYINNKFVSLDKRFYIHRIWGDLRYVDFIDVERKDGLIGEES